MGADIKAGPVLKWAGGKGRLIDKMKKHFPSDLLGMEYYVEPFVGGGAVLFWMLNEYKMANLRIIANDTNADLIGMYITIKDNVEGLIEELAVLQSGLRKTKDPDAYYRERRAEFNNVETTDRLRRSALLIFLNKTCYNGLYRVNRKGEFNVPYGKRKDVSIFNPDLLRKDSQVIQPVEFTVGDYSTALAPDVCQNKAFYYFDPPYRPLTITSSFTNYTKDSFGEPEQIALAKHCRKLSQKHASVMISNSYTLDISPNDTFYADNFPQKKGFNLRRFYHHIIEAPRFLNSDATKRGKIKEILITNYENDPPKQKRGIRKNSKIR